MNMEWKKQLSSTKNVAIQGFDIPLAYVAGVQAQTNKEYFAALPLLNAVAFIEELYGVMKRSYAENGTFRGFGNFIGCTTLRSCQTTAAFAMGYVGIDPETVGIASFGVAGRVLRYKADRWARVEGKRKDDAVLASLNSSIEQTSFIDDTLN